MKCPICNEELTVTGANGVSFGSGDAICLNHINMGSGVLQSHYIVRESPYAGQPPIWYVWFAPPYQITVFKGKSKIYVMDHEGIANDIRHLTGLPIPISSSYLTHALDVPLELPISDPEAMAHRIKTWITFS